MPRDLLDRLSFEERHPFLKKSDISSDNPNSSHRSDETDTKTKTTKKPEDLLKEGTRALIVGSPGAGKSILMRYLALQTLLDEKHKDRFPIFIELKSITQALFTDSKESFETLLLENIVNKATGLDDSRPLIKNYLKQELKEGRVSIFLDGLDEIKAEPFFGKLCDSINTLLKVTNSTNNSLVISSRPYAVSTKFDSIKEMEIAPLSSKQIKEFIKHYYPNEFTKLINQLERKEQKELTRVPLLLSILISLYHKGETVDNKLDLYKLITNHLITTIDKEKNVVRRFNINDPQGSIKLKLLKILAFDKIFDNDNVIKDYSQKFIFTHEEILAKAEKIYPDSIEKASLLTEDIESASIVREIANQKYAFTHLTIQEYLAAISLSEKENSEQLICQKYFDEIIVQLEVLPMAIGLSKNPANIYHQLRGLPESLDYINLKLRIRVFIYLSIHHKNSLLAEIKEISNQLTSLIKETTPSQTLYQDNIFSTVSRVNLLYQNCFVTPFSKVLRNQNTSLSVRNSAIMALGQIGNEKAVGQLIKTLSDLDEDIRDSAAESLGNIKSEKAIEDISKLLGSKNPAIRSSAIETLGYIKDEKTVDSLLKLLHDSDENVRYTLAIALRYMPNKKSVEGLFKLLHDKEKNVFGCAIKSLEKIGSQIVVNKLLNLLNDNDSAIRARAVLALRNIQSQDVLDKLLVLLKDKDEVREAVASVLPTIKNQRAEESLVKLLSDKNIKVRVQAVTALGNIKSEKAIDNLLKLLIDENDYVVIDCAVRSLGQIGNEKAIKPLLELFNSIFAQKPLNFNALAFNIINALKEIKNNQAKDALLEAQYTLIKFLNHENQDLHYQAAILLVQIATPQITDQLLNLLNDKNPIIRANTATHLAYIEPKNKDVIKVLADSLNSKNLDRGICHGIVVALGQIKTKEFINLLLNLSQKPDLEVTLRTSAIWTLGHVGTQKAVNGLLANLLDTDRTVRSSATTALKQVKEKLEKQGTSHFSQALVKAINSKKLTTRKKAAEVAGYYTTEEELIRLLNQLIAQDPNPQVKEIASLALSRYQNKLKLFSMESDK